MDMSMDKASFVVSEYPLKMSFLLDSGSTRYIYNDLIRFQNLRPADKNNILQTGGYDILVKGYGDVDIRLACSSKAINFRL
jgi:hypothetical protein